MGKEVLTSDQLIAKDNKAIALELFYIMVAHGDKTTRDVIEIAKMIEQHGHDFKERIKKKGLVEHGG